MSKKYVFNQTIDTPNGKGILVGISKTLDPITLDMSVNTESGTIKSFFVSHKASDLTEDQKKSVGWLGGPCVTVEYSADQIEGLKALV